MGRLLLFASASLVGAAVFQVMRSVFETVDRISTVKTVYNRFGVHVENRLIAGGFKGVSVVGRGLKRKGRIERLVCRYPKCLQFVEEIEKANLGLETETVLRSLAVCCLLGISVGSLATGSLLSGITLSAGAVLGFRWWVRRLISQKRKKLQDQLPEAFLLVGNALSSGATLVQALEHAVSETRPPISDELAVVVNEVGVGVSLDEALNHMNERLQISEIESVIVALAIQRRAGGNLSELLGKATGALKEQARLHGELMAGTAQARFSGKLVGLMPVVLLAVISLIDPGYLDPLFDTGTGMFMLAVAAIAEVSGFLIINRLLNIEF